MKYKNIVIIIIILFLVGWSYKIARNFDSSTYTEINIKSGKKQLYYGAELMVQKGTSYSANDFLRCYGEEYRQYFQECELNDTIVIKVDMNLSNTHQKEYSIDHVMGAYLRINRGYVTYMEPFMTSQYNDIFNRKNSAGIIEKGEDENISIFYPIYKASFPSNVWDNLSSQDIYLCIPDEKKNNVMYEYEIELGEIE